MSRTLSTLLLLVTLAFAVTACQPIPLLRIPASGTIPPDGATQALPIDPEVRIGKLDNGVTYYIRKNSEPEQRAELWLAINAGSVLEDSDQRGLAHFLEHMLFNGTQEFAGNELVDFLESIGMEFGPDVNAYTSFDETVYTLQVPTDNAGSLATAFDVLREWASHATIAQDEVDAERGVIVEEWRLRDLNASGRVNDELVTTLLKDSRYADRLPIGSMDIVRSAPAETLRRFYETWYRPDNMAVIAVGDFPDLDQVESAIAERFGALQAPAAPLDGPEYTVPDYAGTTAKVITDPEFPATVVYVAYKGDAQPVQTAGEYRTSLVDSLTSQMLNHRFEEIQRRGDAPFLSANTGQGELVRPVKIATLAIQTEDGRAAAGLESAMTEIERTRRYGFTGAELARAKAELLRRFKSTYDERNNIENRRHAEVYLDHFLTGATPTSAADDYALAQRLLPEITLDVVNSRVQERFPQENRAVLLVAPAKEGVSLPDEQALTGILDAAATAEIEPYAGETVGTALMAKAPDAAAIVHEETLPDLGITVIDLANGVKVYLKPTTFKDDQVVVSAYSPGGTSLVSEDDVPEAALAAQIIGLSGVGDFDQTQLDKLLAGKDVQVSPYIDETGEGFQGNASRQDLETLFQLVYLYATQPRVDAGAYETFKRQIQAYLTNRALTPESALEDKYNQIFCGDSVRCNDIALLSMIDQLDLDRALEIYRDRFADLDDAIFMLSGAFDLDTAKQLAQSYLGALPATSRTETWQDVSVEPPTGILTETVNKGIDPRSVVEIVFSGPFTPTVENRVALQMVEGVLDILVREDLREKRGGTYGASISTSIEDIPKGSYKLQIQFTAEPTRVVELTGAVFDEIHDLRENGLSPVNFEKVQEQMRRNQEVNLKRNEAWIAWMTRYLTGNEGQLADLLHIDDAIASVTPEEVQSMARLALPEDTHVALILHPAGFVP